MRVRLQHAYTVGAQIECIEGTPQEVLAKLEAEFGSTEQGFPAGLWSILNLLDRTFFIEVSGDDVPPRPHVPSEDSELLIVPASEEQKAR